MKSAIRPATIDDLEALREFLARVFYVDRNAPFLDANLMTWKYWAPRDDWDGPRSMVVERDGAIVAHAGIWPVTLSSSGRTLRGIQMIDWASSKESAGAGIALVQRLAGSSDFMYTIGGTEATLKILPAFGFGEYTRQTRAVLPLRPVQQMIRHQERNWKLAPRLARNWMWSRAGSRLSSEWDAQPISSEAIDDVLEAKPSSAGAPIPRPGAFFDYLLRCPLFQFRVYGITRRGQPKGHFVLSLVRGQARIAGIWLTEPSLENLTAAFRLTRRMALQQKDAHELVASVSDAGFSRAAAIEAGFRVLPGPPVFVMDKKSELSAFAHLQFQLADNDGAFLDNGTAAYWS